MGIGRTLSLLINRGSRGVSFPSNHPSVQLSAGPVSHWMEVYVTQNLCFALEYVHGMACQDGQSPLANNGELLGCILLSSDTWIRHWQVASGLV